MELFVDEHGNIGTSFVKFGEPPQQHYRHRRGFPHSTSIQCWKEWNPTPGTIRRKSGRLHSRAIHRHREALMEMVKLEIRDMLFETDPATAVAKRHKRSKTVASKDLANKNRNIT